MDVTDIEAGVDFVDVLQKAVGSCDVLLAVMGREWLTCADRNGRRRLDDPHDFIRLEIGTALARKVRVIPVLVEGAVMPTASELASDLEGLTRRQAVELRDARWNADVESLAGVLDRVLVPRTAGNESTRSQPGHAKFWALAAVALISALVAVVMLVPRGGSTPSAPPPQSVSGTQTPAEQRSPVQTQPPASASSEPEARTNPAPATARPTRAPDPPVPQPAPPSVSPARSAPTDVVAPSPLPSTTPVSGGWLGVQLVNADADSSGAGTRRAIVRSVAPGGPAANAGLLAGDLIVEYGGTPVSDVASLMRLAAASSTGDSVLIRVRRGNTGRSIEVVVGDRATALATSGTVMVYYAADDDYKTAVDLAAALRKSINDPRYAVRTLKTSRGFGGEGEVRYSSSGLSPLAEALAKNAGSWLSRTYGRRVAFTPTVEPKVTATGVIVIMPGRASALAVPLVDPVVSILYPAGDDQKVAEDLANFLRTLRSGWKYTVRVRSTTASSKAGQIEYDNERMAALAPVLAKDTAGWISRAYGRRVVLQPTMSGKIGANTVILWLPSR